MQCVNWVFMLDSLLDLRYARELIPLNLSPFDRILPNTINSGQQGKWCTRIERIVCFSINRNYTFALEISGVSRKLPVLSTYFHDRKTWDKYASDLVMWHCTVLREYRSTAVCAMHSMKRYSSFFVHKSIFQSSFGLFCGVRCRIPMVRWLVKRIIWISSDSEKKKLLE